MVKRRLVVCSQQCLVASGPNGLHMLEKRMRRRNRWAELPEIPSPCHFDPLIRMLFVAEMIELEEVIDPGPDGEDQGDPHHQDSRRVKIK